VESSDNDWDIEEESDEENLKEEDDFDFVVKFTIDDDLDDDETDVTIKVFGNDEEENFEHYDELTFSFEIDRERDEVRIISVDFNKNSYSCSDRYAEVDVKFKNTGTDDQDEVRIELISDDLDWHKRLIDIELDEGDSETETFKIDLSEAEGTKEYFVDITAYVETDEETDSEVAFFTYNCGTTTDSGSTTTNPNNPSNPVDSGNTVVVVTPPTDSEVTGNSGNVVYGEPVGTFDDFRGSTLYILLLIAVIIFVIAGIILLGRVLFG